LYFKQKIRNTVWAVSVAVGLITMLIPVLAGLYTPQSPYLIPLNQRVNNTLALGFVIAFAFPAVVESSNYRWGREIDRNIPRLLRDVSEAARSGVTLPRALEEASKRDYGPISKELEHTISMFILGTNWEDSLMSLAQRLRRPSALRLSTILIEAHQTGGKMIEVLDASVDLFSSLEGYREEQHNNMKPYMATIYLATVIFLIIAYIVLHQFLAPLSAATEETALEGSELIAGVLDINYYTSILFWASIIESIFGGLVAGKIGDGTLSAGMVHSVILTFITLGFFNILSI